MSFVVELRELIRWIDETGPSLSKEDVLDGVRVRAVSLMQRFIAFPHCENFSLMPEMP
jgi:hypothetical protein